MEGFIPAWDESRFLAKWGHEAIHVGVKPCDCVAKRTADKLIKYAGLPKHREHCTFDWFDALSPEHKAGKEFARDCAGLMAAGQQVVIEGISRPGIVFAGDTGTGKSSLAACILRDRIKAGQRGIWIDTNEFMDNVYKAQQRMYERERREYPDDEPTNPFEFVDSVAQAPFLILDDFGDMARTKAVTDYQRDKLYTVLRTRYEQELPSVITTNLNVDQLYAHFGKRIADRVGEVWHWIDVTGANLRFER